MKKALVLQGWYQKTDSNWYPWIKAELVRKNYAVYIPDLPTIHTNKPDWSEIKHYLMTNFLLEEVDLIVGHSLGCLMALRLAEEYKFKELILVSGWDFNDLTEEHQLFWESPINHEKIKKNTGNIYCVSSDNDPYFTYDTNESMAKRLNGVPVMVKGAGHFTEKYGVTKIPELLNLIEKIR